MAQSRPLRKPKELRWQNSVTNCPCQKEMSFSKFEQGQVILKVELTARASLGANRSPRREISFAV
jgi:hypothetical protein